MPVLGGQLLREPQDVPGVDIVQLQLKGPQRIILLVQVQFPDEVIPELLNVRLIEEKLSELRT